jgi:hypothetical protein
MVVHPRCHVRLRQRFVVFRKGGPVVEPVPEKVGPFAQDMCSYRVAEGTVKQPDKAKPPEKKQG